MAEFFSEDPDKIGREYESDYNHRLILSISSFLSTKKYGTDYAEDIRDVLLKASGDKPKVPIELSTKMNFHSENMEACRTLKDLENYARDNGFGWLTEDEIQKCKKDAIELMELDSESDLEE